MPALVEKIYDSEADIEEHRRTTAELGKLGLLKDWLDTILKDLESEEKRLKKVEAFRKAFGLLADLTPEEWRLFNEAVRRRPLFGRD
jgi:hypothetical protein